MRYAAGQTLIASGETSDKFCIITAGGVEVVLQRPDGQQIIVERLGRGQYFGVSSLTHGGRENIMVRTAPNTPVETVSLDRATFIGLLQESRFTRDEIDRVVNERSRAIQEQIHA